MNEKEMGEEERLDVKEKEACLKKKWHFHCHIFKLTNTLIIDSFHAYMVTVTQNSFDDNKDKQEKETEDSRMSSS